ncbi:MAG TPA: DUF4129 domain-containing protein [Planctomycetota bacterium]|nr:DUF4129 domain-containing protein [Planctomycetota bacterium]
MVVAGILWLLLGAPSASDVDHALARVRAGDRYQTELPVEHAPEARTARERERRSLERTPERRRNPVEPTDLGPVWRIVLFLVAGALAAALVAWVAREARMRRLARAAVARDEAAPAAAPVVAHRAPAADHEALALRGLFGEAVHSILVLALASIGRAGSGLPPAWTSREVLAASKLGDDAREAFGSLVRLVEVTRFGGLPATEGDYRRALAWLAAIVARRAA